MNRSWWAMIVLTGLAAGCVTTEPPQFSAERSESDPLSTREVVLTVHGLSCPLCSNNLDGQLRRVEGVDEAIIDLKTGAVSVRLAEGHSVSRADLARAVQDAGFTLRNIEPKGANP